MRHPATLRLYLAFAAVGLLCMVAALVGEAYWLALLPFALLVVGVAIIDFRPLFWLLLICIPLGTEITLPGGFGTDLPTEPLAIALTFLLIVHAASHWPEYDSRRFTHPIVGVLALHVSWILVTTAFSEHTFISVKFSLAKLWYIGAFFALPLLLLRSPGRVIVFVHCVMWPLLFVALQALARHATYDFSFADQFRTLHPFMRNHVSYAGCLAAFFPWVVYLRYYRKSVGKSYRWLHVVMGVWLVATALSFTRAAYIALALAAVAYFIIRWRLLRPAVLLATVMAIGVAVYLVRDENYLNYAPNYDTTVTHQNFDDLISATYQLEDISTMERFYRWVAGGNMVPYRPVTGFGPGSFVASYEGYTNNNFQTYVSDNPERSGIHNYYLMTLVEQGYPGLLFYLLFVIASLVYGEKMYHRQRHPHARMALMAALLSLIIVGALNLINDLIETDKVGSLFFIATAVTIAMGTFREEETIPPAGLVDKA